MKAYFVLIFNHLRFYLAILAMGGVWVMTDARANEKDPWSFAATLSGGYDSNVVLDPVSLNLHEDTDSFRGSVSFNAKYRQKRSPWQAQYSGYGDFYTSMTENNFQAHTASFSYNHKVKPYSWNFRVATNKYLLDGSGFLGLHQFQPTFIYLKDAKALWLAKGVAQIQNYDDSSEQDGSRFGLSAARWFLQDKELKEYWSITLSGGVENVEQSSLDFNYYEIAIDKNWKWRQIMLKADVRYEQRDYKDIDTDINAKEERDSLSAGLRFDFLPWFRKETPYIQVRYTDLDSNNSLNAYRRWTSDLGFSWTW